MPRTRLGKAAVLLGAVLGLLAPASPARATTVTNLTFQGVSGFSGGMSYPCIGAATPDLAKCPSPLVSPGAPPGKTVTVTGGNTRAFFFASAVCVGASGAASLVDSSAGAGVCAMTASGVATGSCGLTSGLLVFTVKVDELAVLVVPAPKLIALLTVLYGTIHFTGVGGTVVFFGEIDGSGGAVVGVVESNTIPDISGFPGMPDNSCLSKTADTFTIMGEAALIEP